MGSDGEMDQREPDLICRTGPVLWLDPRMNLWLEIARLAGLYGGTCARRNVGAVLTASSRLREVGWNGMERAADSVTCMGGGCPRGKLSKEEQPPGVGYSNCIYLHAELNVADNFRHSQRIRNVQGWAKPLEVTIYSSSNPCEDCVKYAAWAGIDLVWEGSNGDQVGARSDPAG
jgi:deoxycytidylate deaminase